MPRDADSAAEDRTPLGFLLRQAAGAHRLQIDRALADLAVTAPQFLVMTLLAAEPGLSNADLARRMAQSMPTLSVIVSNLKRRGLVVARAHAAHGRIRELHLTAAGIALHAECGVRGRIVERQLEAPLTREEQAVIRRWLARAE